MPELCEDVILMICDYLLPPNPRKKNNDIPKTPQDMLSWSTGHNSEAAKILFDLALINKNWNDTCGRLLYRFISVREKSSRRINVLLDTCARRPAKAAEVQTIYLRRRRKLPDEPCSDAIIASVNARLDNLEISDQLRQCIHSGLQVGNADAKMAALLCICRNLEELQIIDSCQVTSSIMLNVLGESMMCFASRIGAALSPPGRRLDDPGAGPTHTHHGFKSQGHEQYKDGTDSGPGVRHEHKFCILPKLKRVRAGWKERSTRRRYYNRWPPYEDFVSFAVHSRLLVFPIQISSDFTYIISKMPSPHELVYHSRHDSGRYYDGPWWMHVAPGLVRNCTEVRTLTLEDSTWTYNPLTWTTPALARLTQLDSLTIDRCILFARKWNRLNLRRELPPSLRVLRIFGQEYWHDIHTSEYQDEQLVKLARDPKFSRLSEIQLQLDTTRAYAQVKSYMDALNGTCWAVSHDSKFRVVTLRKGDASLCTAENR